MYTVRIFCTGLDFRQDAEPLIRSFYPGGVTDAPCAVFIYADERSYSLSLRTYEPASTCGEAADGSGAEESADMFSVQTACHEGELTSSETDPKAKHRDDRNEILRGIYRMLGEATGKQLPWGILTGVRPTKLILERIERGEAGHLSFMKERYLCSSEKAALATRVSAREYKLLENLDLQKGYSLYVGIPFCPSICNYCSFGSHPIDRFASLVEPYIEALMKEIRFASECFPGRKLQTVYFGGGTPTAVSAQQLRMLIRCVKESFDMSGVLEFTVEAGRPDSVTAEKLDMLSDEGISRISVNPQSMVSRTLETIGRRHTPEQIVEAFRLARSAGFDNINMDIIAGLTGETIDDFRYTLGRIEELDPDSLTVHTLAHKRAARLTTEAELYAGMEARDVPLMVGMASEYAASHGYEPYYLYRQKNMTDNLENVGYAKPGKECLYNVLIMEEKQLILAVGAGASSKFVRDCDERFERVENVKNVAEYISRIDEMIGRKRSYIEEHGII